MNKKIKKYKLNFILKNILLIIISIFIANIDVKAERKEINATRRITATALEIVDSGSADTYYCGKEVFIDYCDDDFCYCDANKSKNKSCYDGKYADVKIDRYALTDGTPSCPSTNTPFRVTFVGNGGKFDGRESFGVTCTGSCSGANLDKTGYVVRTGYTFKGWSLDPNCYLPKTSIGSNSDIKSYRNYYACWDEKNSTSNKDFKVTVAGNGGVIVDGTIASNNGKADLVFDCKGNCPSFTDIDKFQYSGFKWIGWSKSDKNCNGTLLKSIPDTTERTTYYACWEPNTSNETNTTSPSTSDKYYVEFNFYNGTYQGSGDFCPGLTHGNKMCYANINKGNSVTVPSLNFKQDNNKLLGYALADSNGLAECVESNFVKDTVTVNSNAKYYACYNRYINSERIANTDIKDSNNRVIYSCGQSIYVTYCTTEADGTHYCYDSANNKFLANNLAKVEDKNKINCNQSSSTEQPGTSTDTRGPGNFTIWAKGVITSEKGVNNAYCTDFWIEYSENGRYYYPTENGRDSISMNDPNISTTKVECSTQQTPTTSGKETVDKVFYIKDEITTGNGVKYNCTFSLHIDYSENGKYYFNVNGKLDSVSMSEPNLMTTENKDCKKEIIKDIATQYYKKTNMYPKREVKASNGITYKTCQPIFIQYCSNNICTFLDDNKEVTIDETALAYTPDGLNCSANIETDVPVNDSDAFNYFKFMRANKVVKDSYGKEWECGQDFYITSCDKDNCYFDGDNGITSITRSDLSQDLESVKCTTEVSNSSEIKYTTIQSIDYKCGEQIKVYNCEDDVCDFRTLDNVTGYISKNNFTDTESKAKEQCDKINVTDKKYTCSNNNYKNQEETSLVTLCYNEDDSEEENLNELKDIYKCNTSKGYKFDETKVVYEEGTRACTKKGKCVATYSVTCSKDKESIKPNMSVTSGIVGSDGYGEIIVKAYSNEGSIYAYYMSEIYETPSNKVDWIEVNSNNFPIKTTPGIKYIWVKDSKNNISNAVSGAVLDNINTNTTISTLELRDGSGIIQNPDRVSYNDNSITNSKYALLSNDLGKDSKVLADGFNPFDMEYKIEVSSPTISVYATLTSTDSNYVSGYEPRTVNLNYGINTILIKIQNKEGKIRTYTILVTRTDDRNADNTLNDIKLSVGNINFNANVTDYKIEIPKNTKNVNVDSKISSDVAKYVEGYEPGNVTITGDTTVKLIKVMSQTGSTRTYVLTFVKEGTDTITDETLQLNDLVIPGAYFSFERGIANYSTTVGYETETVDIRLNLKDETSTYVVGRKTTSNGKYVYGSNLGVGLSVGENFIEIKITNNKGETSYYRLTIIRKEFGLEVENDNTLKDLKVLGHVIKFNPNEKEYTVRIKQEKSLVITAVPNSNRAEVFIRGNDELTGFSTVRVKVVAENGEFTTYSIDIKKDAFNKAIEITAIVVGAVIILGSSAIIIIKKKNKTKKEYFEE
ncbi:MAG: cadherin-like beta sandwich domain-containing protein [Bacilli bacterium]|nr:cadherin-like beta sandwich domain-containing protein [Bacilli bacterium]